MSGSIAQLENIEHHTLCPWICLIVLITIISIEHQNFCCILSIYTFIQQSHIGKWGKVQFLPFYVYIKGNSHIPQGAFSNLLCLRSGLKSCGLLCGVCTVASLVYTSFFDWFSITVTYCSLKLFSSCGVMLDLLHVLNCDPKSRTWRGPGGVLSEKEGGGAKKNLSSQFLRS